MADQIAADVKDQSVEPATTTEESSTEEIKQPGNGDDAEFEQILAAKDKSEAQTTDESAEADATEAKADEDSDEAEDDAKAPKKGAEARKEQLNSEIRDLVSERNRVKAEIAKINAEAYQVANRDDIPTVEQLVDTVNPETGDYYTRSEAKTEIIQRELEIERQARAMDSYNTQIAENLVRLSSESEKAINDFPMFDNQSESYNEGISPIADEVFAATLITDPKTGKVIGSRVSPYKFYGLLDAAVKLGATQGEIKGKQAVQKMMDNVEVQGSGQGDRETNFSKLSLEQQAEHLRKRGFDV